MCAEKGLLTLFENFGHVAECECGTIHVSVGTVSVALDSHALRRLHGMLGSAIERLDHQVRELTKNEPLLVHSSHLALKKVMKIKH
jgi:hypothetical protein